MTAIIVFMIKAALYLAVFYLVYALLLSRDTSYGRNRVFILLSVALSLLLPAFTLHTSRPMDIQLFGRMLNEVFITSTSGHTDTLSGLVPGADPFRLIYTLYFIGVLILLLKLVTDLLNLLILISRQKENGSRIIRFNSFNTSGFSAMGYIFLNSKLSPEESEEIIKHEQNHLRRNHFLDIIFIEAIKAFQWFNPSVYLFDRSLRAIHEYQADLECLNSGIPVVSYQNLLLNQVFRSKTFNLTNSFSNPSMVRKRMIMMTKKRTSALAGMKLLLSIPAAGIIFMAISAYAEIPDEKEINTDPAMTLTNQPQEMNASEIPENTPYVSVEEMPAFPGGDIALLKYLAENTVYPEAAKKNNITGRVVVRFCVTETGSVNKISILRGVDPELDAEAMRVVGTLPAFNPGRQAGKPVPVWYMVPLTFALK